MMRMRVASAFQISRTSPAWSNKIRKAIFVSRPIDERIHPWHDDIARLALNTYIEDDDSDDTITPLHSSLRR